MHSYNTDNLRCGATPSFCHPDPPSCISSTAVFQLLSAHPPSQKSRMPIGKLGGYAGKGGDYSSGNVNVQHTTEQSESFAHAV